MADNLRKKIQKAIAHMKLADLENLFWYLTVEGLIWEEVIQMYLIGRKGVWTKRTVVTYIFFDTSPRSAWYTAFR